MLLIVPQMGLYYQKFPYQEVFETEVLFVHNPHKRMLHF
jgi:hypothetical protein